jgi:hypothetical protein
VNSPQPPTKRHQSSQVSKSAIAVMLVVLGTLALLAIFANVQRFRRGDVETVVVKPLISPTPQSNPQGVN